MPISTRLARLMDGLLSAGPPVGETDDEELAAGRSWFDDTRRTGLTLLGLALLGCAVLAAWMAFAPINRGATAIGQVQVENRRTVVQHLDGGIVERVLVREGDLVREGQLLLQLDDAAAALALGMVEKQYRLLLIEQALLRAELEERPLVWPPEVTRFWRDPETADAVRTSRTAQASEDAALAAKKAELAEQIKALAEHASGIEAQRRAALEQSRLIAAEHEMVSSLHRRSLLPLVRVLAIERARADMGARVGSLTAALDQDQVQMRAKRQAMAQLDARDRSRTAARLQEIHVKLTELGDRIDSRRLAVERTLIRAPSAGVVLRLGPRVAGYVVRPGDAVLELVPDRELLVSALMGARDIERVRIGAPATVTFPGMNPQTRPRLAGTVSYVSADQIADNDGKLIGYEVRVVVAARERARIRDVALKTGMPAQLMVDTGSRTTLAYLTEPLRRSFSRAFRE